MAKRSRKFIYGASPSCALGDAQGKFTVRKINEMLRSASYTGTFDDEASAIEYAKREARNSRSFAYFEVWTGTPRQPGCPTGFVVRGEA